MLSGDLQVWLSLTTAIKWKKYSTLISNFISVTHWPCVLLVSNITCVIIWLSAPTFHSSVQAVFCQMQVSKRGSHHCGIQLFFSVLKELGHLKNTKSYRRDWKSQMMLVLAICDRAQELLIRQRLANYSYPWWSESGVSTERAGVVWGGGGRKMIYDLIKAFIAAWHFGAGVWEGVWLRVDWLSFQKWKSKSWSRERQRESAWIQERKTQKNLELFGLFLQRLLVDLKLFSCFWTGLTS